MTLSVSVIPYSVAFSVIFTDIILIWMAVSQLLFTFTDITEPGETSGFASFGQG